ncbi:MAG: glycosyltransferase [Bacteroidales bacterium]|jgi:glycosyltransferase involved in cell wall biosynthesis|nr:glycosyltransferase [Bacteroidales bacterium]
MNILFLAPVPIIPSNGGVQRVTDTLSREFIRRGHKVTFLSTKKPYPGYPNADFTDFSCPQEYIIGLTSDKKKAIAYYLQLLKAYSIDIIICQDITSSCYTLLRRTPKNIRIITVYHSKPFGYRNLVGKYWKNNNPNSIRTRLLKCVMSLFPKLGEARYFLIEKRKFKKIIEVSDKLCLLSSKYIIIINDFVGNYPRKLISFGNPNSFDIPQNVDVFSKQNLVIFVGRIDMFVKNLKDFIKMWRIISEKNKEWRATIVGDGQDLDYLKKYSRENNIQRLEFVGNQTDVISYYKKAKFVCLTSVFEGWSMVLTEGMSYGCIPCVYGTYGAAYDIVDNNKCGFVTTPFSPEEMAEKIQSLIEDENLRQKFAFNAIEKVKMFTVEKIADKWEELFDSLS